MTECSPVMSSASPIFDQYREKFVARPPNLVNQIHDDETSDLRANLEVQSFPLTPMPHQVRLSQDFADDGKKYLWLIGENDVPFALEKGPLGLSTQRGTLSHTNLSGGANAHSGGELWFADAEKVVMNGGSSRYCPRSIAELDCIADCMRLAGYKVVSCGWADETNAFARKPRGVLEWK